MIGQAILSLVRKPYKLSLAFVRPIIAQSKMKIPVKALHYLFADQAGIHDILFEDRTDPMHSSLYDHSDLVLKHDLNLPDENGIDSGYTFKHTPIVPSATITHDKIKAMLWLSKEWFGSEEMERPAEEVIGSILADGCVIYDYELNPVHGTLAHIDTNLGRYVLPASYLDSSFLDLSCFKTEVEL